jgi:hypothetical protein
MNEASVTQVIPATTGLEPLIGFQFDYPVTGVQRDAYSLDIGGWVVGRDSAPLRVEIRHEHRIIRETEVWMPRADLADKLSITEEPLLKRAGSSGFHASVSLLGLPESFLLQVEAVFDDETRVILGTVAGTRHKLQPTYQSKLQPITLTHIARSGSTWLTHLLAEHPGVVVHRRYPFEDVTALYGMRMLDVLATPCNPLQQKDVHEMKDTLNHIGPLPIFCQHEDPPMHAWVRKQYVDRLATFSMEWVDAFYGEVAIRQKKPQARYFSEKLFQNSRHSDLFAEMYPGGKEVFLIRDFRDVLCSSFSFRVEKKEMERMILKFRGRVSEILHGWKTRGSRGHLLRYEDLIQKPVETLQALFNYLQLDSDPSMMNKLLEKATRATPDLTKHQTAGGQQRSVKRWERDMDETQQALCQEHLGEALKAFGY